MRKVRSDSVLGSLPEETQQLVYETCSSMHIGAAVSWLAQAEEKGGMGIKTSASALSVWLAGKRTEMLVRRLRQGRERLDAVDAELKGADGSKYDPVTAEAFKEYSLNLLATQQVDGKQAAALQKAFLASQQLQLEREKLELEKLRMERDAQRIEIELKKIDLMQVKAAKEVLARAKDFVDIASDAGLSSQDKVDRARRILFGDAHVDGGKEAA